MSPSVDLIAHRASMTRLATYVATARLIDRLFWKDYKGGQVLVGDPKADPAFDPVELILVATVTRGSSSLGALGNYNPDYENMAKAKISFTVEAPADPGFNRDYAAAVQLFRRLQESAAQGPNRKNLLASPTPNSNVRVSHALFRKKEDDEDGELLPEGNISDQPGDEFYFPTAANWPVSETYRSEFMSVADAMVFEPLHVFNHDGSRVDPSMLAARLPGALVEIHFTLRHWSLVKQNTDSFNAEVQQIIILQSRVGEASPVRKACRQIRRPKASIPNTPIEVAFARTGKRGIPADATQVMPAKRARLEDNHDKGEGPSGSKMTAQVGLVAKGL
ncbi:hypothetical protein ONZ45_g5521 [Pleurotus djamor]|nr:hypothetical protein ONZ45_g5521 [Pleurotus djamor]